MCAVCKKPVLGRFFSLGQGRSIHETCFCCSACRTPLDAFFEGAAGSLLCPRCFSAQQGKESDSSATATMCHACNKLLNATEASVVALGHSWHAACFVCNSCHKPITAQCLELEGNPYCSSACLERAEESAAAAPRCAKCNKVIAEGCDYLIVGDNSFHSTCFVCAHCSAPLAGVDFFDVNGQTLCGACVASR